MKNRVVILICMALLALFIAGCSDQEPGSGQKTSAPAFTPSNTYAGDLSGITLNVGSASADLAQSIVKAAGLADTPYTVNYHNLRGGNLVLEAMAAGQLDAGCGSQIPPIFASRSQNGGNFKIIAIRKGNTLDQELITGPGSKDTIKTVADLKGKKVGYVKNTTAQYFLYKMLVGAGMEWKDIDALPLSTSDGLSAVITGDIDALASYGNSIISAKDKGAVTVRSGADILSGDYYWYASPETIRNPAKHAALVDYLERINEADEWARQHPDEWAAYYAKETNQDAAAVKKQFVEGEQQIKGRIAPLDDKTILSEQDIIDSFLSIGVLAQPIPAAGLFDRSFDQEIAKFTVY